MPEKQFNLTNNNQQTNTSSDQNIDKSKHELQTNKSDVIVTPVKPSFDCSKVIYIAEKMICDDHELTQLDNEMGVQYANYLGQESDKNH